MGAAAGGAGGALAPAGSDEQARTNALYGLLAGGVAAPVVNAIGATGNWIGRRASETADLFRKGDEGAANIVRRYISSPKVVGKEAMPGVVETTREAAEIIPGGKPTVAEAVFGKPGASPLSALQHISSKTGGGSSDEFTASLPNKRRQLRLRRLRAMQCQLSTTEKPSTLTQCREFKRCDPRSNCREPVLPRRNAGSGETNQSKGDHSIRKRHRVPS